MKRKYLGRFWNVFLPVSMTAIMLIAACRIVLFQMPSYGSTTDWFSIVVIFGVYLVFVNFRNKLDRSDEEGGKGMHRVCISNEEWGRVVQNDPSIDVNHVS